MRTTSVSTAQDVANRAAEALKENFDEKIFGHNINVHPDFDGYEVVIVWEEGPHEWPYEEVTKSLLSNVCSGTEFHYETLTHYSVAIYNTGGHYDQADLEPTNGGRCEDAPCCGCCGRSLYGSEDTYYSGTGELYDDPSYEDYLNRY